MDAELCQVYIITGSKSVKNDFGKRVSLPLLPQSDFSLPRDRLQYKTGWLFVIEKKNLEKIKSLLSSTSGEDIRFFDGIEVIE